MKKSTKISIIVITLIILVIGLLILSLPLIIMMLDTPVTLRSTPVDQFEELKEDYIIIANFAKDNIEVVKDSEFSGFVLHSDGAIRCGDDYFNLTNEEVESVIRIVNESFCERIDIYDRMLVFGGIDGDKIAYAYKGRPPIILKNDTGTYFRPVNVEDNWYALVEIPKLL